MPNKDKTGPKGEGPRTGLKKGTCSNEKELEGRGPCGKGLRKGLGRRFSKENN